MSANSIPQPRQPIAGTLTVDATWYRWLRDLDRLASESNADNAAEIEALCRKLGSPDGTIQNIPPPSTPALVGDSPVSVNGAVIGLETVGTALGGSPLAVTVDAFGRVTQNRPIEPGEIPEDFRVWLTDETGAYLTDELGRFLCEGGVQLPYVRNFLGLNQPNPIRRLHIVGADGPLPSVSAALGARHELYYENNGNTNVTLACSVTSLVGINFTIPSDTPGAGRFSLFWAGSDGVTRFRTVGVDRIVITASGSVEFPGTTAHGTGSGTMAVGGQGAGQVSTYFRFDGTMASAMGGVPGSYFPIWNAGNSAQVIAGTINGQLATWNTAAGRYDPVTAAGLTNAANDAAAATAGVPVSGLYRNGSVLQIRVT